MTLLRADLAPPPRTLVDILLETVSRCGDQPAVDNGSEVLTYDELLSAAEDVAIALRAVGVRRGDRVGVRIRSGTTDLYVAIAGVLVAGAAYVPVDAEDPDERARTVFAEASVAAVLGDDLVPVPQGDRPPPAADEEPGPEPADDAWVIFTSGSTGTPKGVAVSHRNAAAFVDAESRMFLQDRPIGPGDRVMAGLSVAFDASCEEMWLAWAYGACLVPAPRSLVRSGIDLGPWLVANEVTVVSTVPTLVAMWPPESLDRVRLLILGGEACPPEIGERFATGDREVWNTYGPTEATVVACGARLDGGGPVLIGLPLDGWDLAVVDADGRPVAPGVPGELIIGGVGLARYLDAEKDAEKYAPMPSLGWDRAYRTGDLVRQEEAGLAFLGRADDQIKFGGRRIELGEIDNALLALPGVEAAATAVRSTKSGNKLLVGYLATAPDFEATAALARLRASLPAALVPRLVAVDALPTRTSGKVDRDALPWPAPAIGAGERTALAGTEAWIQELWSDILGADVANAKADFFDLGGGSLTAAQLVSRLRERAPEITVADVYDASRLDRLAELVDGLGSGTNTSDRTVPPVPRKTQLGQVAALLPLRAISGLRVVVWLALATLLARAVLGLDFLPDPGWGWVLLGWLLLIFPAGRILLSALGARLVLAGIEPGRYPRGGRIHLRVWLAERLVDELGAANLAGAAAIRWYARALGARVGKNVDLHALPPVTGMLELGNGCSVETEVDLTGHWVDGDHFHLGRIVLGSKARIGARSLVLGGATVGDRAEIAPGSAVLSDVAAGEYWSGAPAIRAARSTRGPWDDAAPANRPAWLLAYAASGAAIALLPVLAVLVAAGVFAGRLGDAASLDALASTTLGLVVPGTLIGLVVIAAVVLVGVRVLGAGLESGHFPVHGRQAWQAWSTLRVLDEARTWLFPLYASSLTPTWLRALGARIGKDVEASTVLMIPKLTTVNDGAFLADDTLIGGYELGGGWFRIDRVRIGKHAFVGNSGMAAPGRKVPKEGLVAVLSAAPRRAKAKAGTSWIGSPPTKLRRVAGEVDDSRTFRPPTRLRVARAGMELCRLVPAVLNTLLWWAVAFALLALADSVGWWLAAVLAGPVLLLAGGVAAASATAAKWLLIGRVRPGRHPLWSAFVWRNELADTFVEVLAAPWFARPVTGSWVLNLWLRSLGAKIGRGVWCETYWLPEADLVELRDGSTVNQGCVVQTHLFHDRMLSMDTVTLRAGATLGPASVILPAATLGKHATVGPVSLVMRGETVPDRTRWTGNPIGPWAADE
ncbi:Pls/PosA family non-ribosomal peptide synthetase [Marmoricola sp. RAF53]|uniref:Pls/PosA family non-ribosomal peptide synthetase n=1 Tax=Marmoricola sp. RAF53 TaxID=3233059 RepID=UPI003F996257